MLSCTLMLDSKETFQWEGWIWYELGSQGQSRKTGVLWKREASGYFSPSWALVIDGHKADSGQVRLDHDDKLLK